MDVKSAVGRVGVDPKGSVIAGYVLADLMLGYVSAAVLSGEVALGGGGGVSRAVKDAQRKTTIPSAKEYVRVVSWTTVAVTSLTEIYEGARVQGSGGERIRLGSPYLWMLRYVVVSLDGEWRFLDLSRSLTHNRSKLLGVRDDGGWGEPLLPHMKATPWASNREVLGFWMDTASMAVSVRRRKMGDWRARRELWPPDRKGATVIEGAVPVGKLHHAAIV